MVTLSTKIALIPLLLASLTSTPTEVEKGIVLNNDNNIQLEVPFVHQINNLSDESKTFIRGTACGPAVLTMALNNLGIDINLDNVIARLPDSVYVKGDKFYKLSKGPEYFKKEAKEIEPTPKEIFDALKNGNPVILNIQNYDGITGHAVLVTGIRGFDGENAQSLIVHDPFVGPYRKFDYVTKNILRQPEGYYTPIGIIKPFTVS